MDSGEREALAACALRAVERGDAEVIVADTDEALTRFTRNAIHQNVQYRELMVRYRIVLDGRTGCVETNATDDAGLREAARRAADLAAHSPPNPDYPGMQAPSEVPAAPAGSFDADSANATPERRAAIAADIFSVAERNGLWAAGFVSSGRRGVTVANTSGTLLSFDSTDCGAAIKQNGEDSTGYAERFCPDIGQLDGEALGEIAADKALRSKNPSAVEPGTWTVIFEPAAFAELLAFLADHFSARAYDEGSSFLSGGGLGSEVTGESVTILDDYAHPLGPSMPFDYEGAPKRRVTLLDAGVGASLVTDRYWARKLGRENTGHALPAPSSAGPQALNLAAAPGDKPLETLISETERGLLVTRLWYTRTVDQRKTIVTGMTRDGTFLIEGGRIVRGVRNLRFNQSVLEMLRAAEFSSGPARSLSYNSSIVVPSVRIDRFTFSSLTDF